MVSYAWRNSSGPPWVMKDVLGTSLNGPLFLEKQKSITPLTFLGPIVILMISTTAGSNDCSRPHKTWHKPA